MSEIHTHRYENGLTLLAEPIQGMASCGMTLLLPAGAAVEPSERLGVGSVLSEMVFRGAGDLNARQHSDALDRLGVHRGAEVATWHLRLGATMMGRRIERALPLLLDMVRRPHLNEEAFDPSRQLALHGIEGLEDNPQEKVMLELKRLHLGEPVGRSVYGDADHLREMCVEDIREHYRRRFVPGGAILAFAGRVDFEHVKEKVGELLGDWSGEAGPLPRPAPPPHGYHHIASDTTQQHIGLAHTAVGARDAATMKQRLAVAVLSGGMSGRLFTEVRENRGLCYAVYAAYMPQRDDGTVYAYAGTTNERAAETLEVLRAELERIGEGADAEEFERAVVGLKSRVVMQGESTGARARAAASDQFLRGRPRTLDEMEAEIDSVGLDELNAFLRDHRPTDFTTLTVGPEPLVAEHT